MMKYQHSRLERPVREGCPLRPKLRPNTGWTHGRGIGPGNDPQIRPGAFQPPGYFCLASSSETAGKIDDHIVTCFQFTGVATCAGR
jgi:hypothetical protein